MSSIISSIVLWSVTVFIILRILHTSGVNLGNSKAIAFITKDNSLSNSFAVTTKDCMAVFGITLFFRLIVFGISVFAIFIMDDSNMTLDGILNKYVIWDANNYYRIAKGGYSYYVENGNFTTLAFFPLYPWLMRIVNCVINNYTVSGLLTSSLLYSGACVYIYKLLAIDYSKSTAIRTLVFISVFPHALFFGTMMNESTLLFFSAATLYYARTHNWPLVGIMGAFAAMSRMIGIALAIPAAVEWLEHYKIFKKLGNKSIGEIWKLFYQKGLWIFLMLFGTGVYLYCNYKTTGEWFKFLEYQETVWHQGSQYFGKSIQLIIDRAAQDESFTKFSLWIPEVIATIFTVVTLVYGIRKTKGIYLSFLLVYIIINSSLTWPLSIARYMTCAIPSFVILADFSERHKWTEPVITASMAIAFGVFFTAYFMAKQVL